jgi:hypothetical protein
MTKLQLMKPLTTRGKKVPSLLYKKGWDLKVNFVLYLLTDSPRSEFYVHTFRNTLSVPSS